MSTKISGFTVIRNAEKMGYPVIESIRSLLPLVDEMIIGVGDSDDNTLELIKSIDSEKIKTFNSIWDMSRTSGGLILSEKTNEALEHCKNEWCFYLQADEVLHEEDYENIKSALAMHADDSAVQGLLFNYVHFYGSYQTIAQSRRWYRREIRLFRKSTGAQSYKDAQGFRIAGKKLNVAPTNARVFHYGWVKPPKMMGQKAKMLDYWWHGAEKKSDDEEAQNFAYDNQYGLHPFKQTHPEVMRQLVASQDWQFLVKRTLRDWKIKDFRYLLSDVFEKISGHRLGEYRPYKLIK